MSKHHRNRNWAPAPQPLPEDAHVIDNHTHVASVVPFSQAMSHEAMEKGQGEVPAYSVDELLEQAQKVGVEGVIDCGCELPNLMTAIDMAREHPGTVHAAIAIHPNEAVLHGHRGAPGPDGLPIKYKPWHDIPFDEAMAEVHRLATTYPNQVVAIGETGMDLFRTLHNALGELPIVAEDLGEMFDSVRQLLADSGFPGMKVLQFAFTGQDSVDLPHNYPRNCVAYPGTHDNNTLAGWFNEELTPAYRQQAIEYFALNKGEGELRGMLRGVLASTAALAIIPMADWLEEPSASRMNTPGVAQGNWQWRVDEKKLTPALAKEIKAMAVRYFRAPAKK